MLRPGMLYGKVLRPPAYNATLKDVDVSAGKAPGVTVVRDGGFVGVAAPDMLAAERAVDALSRTATWDVTPLPPSAGIYDYLRSHAQVPENPFAAELSSAAKSLRATYHAAYIAHAPLGTRAGLAEWDGGKLTVWLGTRNPFGCRSEIARAFGLSDDAVRVIVPDYGGGWGGNHPADAGLEAARIAKAVGAPVLVRWTRKEEFDCAYFRPAAVIDAEAGLDAAGRITSWHFVNINSGGSAVDTPYSIGRRRCQFVRSASPLRQGSYRALAATANNFAREAFMDELAGAAGRTRSTSAWPTSRTSACAPCCRRPPTASAGRRRGSGSSPASAWASPAARRRARWWPPARRSTSRRTPSPSSACARSSSAAPC